PTVEVDPRTKQIRVVDALLLSSMRGAHSASSAQTPASLSNTVPGLAVCAQDAGVDHPVVTVVEKDGTPSKFLAPAGGGHEKQHSNYASTVDAGATTLESTANDAGTFSGVEPVAEQGFSPVAADAQVVKAGDERDEPKC
ncbi:unnamed protein product, partial [Amoebophrya sp. A120]